MVYSLANAWTKVSDTPGRVKNEPILFIASLAMDRIILNTEVTDPYSYDQFTVLVGIFDAKIFPRKAQ